MSLPPDYLDYKHRHHGMDHDRYDWSMLARRKPVTWPGGARIALWLVPALEFFPLDMKGSPFKPPGAMVTAYPDLRHWTLRDYGNRVGIYRLMRALAERNLTASCAVNAAVAQRYPSLLQDVVQAGWEVLGHGRTMDDLQHGGLKEYAEAVLIQDALAQLREATGQAVRGWLSPARSQSFATLDLLAAQGVQWQADWANDDMPYEMRSKSGPIYAMPHNPDIDDYTILIQNHHPEPAFTEQLVDQFDYLYDEAGRQGGRIMAISLHPWIIGQPYRIGALEQALDTILARPGVWCATGSDILASWLQQQ